jgi:copper chaperone CopZ
VHAYQTAQEEQPAGPSNEVVLEISGMHCAACSSKVEHALGQVDGVRTASVSLLSKSAKVDFEPRRVTLPTLLTAVKKTGYTAMPRGGTDDASTTIVPQNQVRVRSRRCEGQLAPGSSLGAHDLR